VLYSKIMKMRWSYPSLCVVCAIVRRDCKDLLVIEHCVLCAGVDDCVLCTGVDDCVLCTGVDDCVLCVLCTGVVRQAARVTGHPGQTAGSQ
jgi:hypothetical protein